VLFPNPGKSPFSANTQATKKQEGNKCIHQGSFGRYPIKMSHSFRFSSCQTHTAERQLRAVAEDFKKLFSKLGASAPAALAPLLLASGGTWKELQAGFQARGVAVLGSHRRCAEPGLEGLYVRGSRAVVVCRRGDPTITLRHEGWHLVQSLCLAGRPWLPPDSVARQLGRRDRREIELLVPPSQWPREAEARVMARLAPGPYFQQLDQACGERLNPPPASPDPPGSSR
jgi:hypothetical protein